MSDLAILQQKLGLPGSGLWDAGTQAALVKFQMAAGLPATGDPDPATLAKAGVYDPLAEAPTGKGTFGRDVVTAFNQVPQWAWLVLGGVSLTVAYLAYRKRNPKKS